MTTITTESGLQYIELTVGEGDEAKAGQNVTCLLYTSDAADGNRGANTGENQTADTAEHEEIA